MMLFINIPGTDLIFNLEKVFCIQESDVDGEPWVKVVSEGGHTLNIPGINLDQFNDAINTELTKIMAEQAKVQEKVSNVVMVPTPNMKM